VTFDFASVCSVVHGSRMFDLRSDRNFSEQKTQTAQNKDTHQEHSPQTQKEARGGASSD